MRNTGFNIKPAKASEVESNPPRFKKLIYLLAAMYSIENLPCSRKKDSSKLSGLVTKVLVAKKRLSISKFKRLGSIAALPLGNMAAKKIIVNLTSWQHGRVAAKDNFIFILLIRARVIRVFLGVAAMLPRSYNWSWQEFYSRPHGYAVMLPWR